MCWEPKCACSLDLVFAGKCPRGWITAGHGDCYKFVTSEKKSWQQAEATCKDLGGYLATLATLDDIYWMKGYRAHHSILQEETWIGGYNRNNVWYWMNYDLGLGAPITRFDWINGMNPYKVEDPLCLQLAGSTGFVSNNPQAWFKWDDLTCSVLRPFICEYDALS